MLLTEDLNALLDLPAGWDSYGSACIDPRAVGMARAIASALSAVPTVAGGIQLECHVEGFDLELEIRPDGDVRCVVVEYRP